MGIGDIGAAQAATAVVAVREAAQETENDKVSAAEELQTEIDSENQEESSVNLSAKLSEENAQSETDEGIGESVDEIA